MSAPFMKLIKKGSFARRGKKEKVWHDCYVAVLRLAAMWVCVADHAKRYEYDETTAATTKMMHENSFSSFRLDSPVVTMQERLFLYSSIVNLFL